MSRFCVPFMSHCSNGEVQFFLSLSFTIAQVCLYVFYNTVLSLTVLHYCSVPELASLLNSLLLTGYEPCTLTWEPSRVQLKFLGFLCLLYQGISSRTQPPEAFLFLSKSCKWLDCVWANKVVGNNSKHCPRVLCTAHQDCCWSDLSSFLCTSQEQQNRL